MSEAAVEVRDLVKRYGSGAKAVTALRGVSLRVGAGEIYGLLGRNGAGKTTLVKILLDIVRPSGGSAEVLGHRAGSMAARVRLGYLPEDHRFPDYRTGEGLLHHYAMLAGMSARDRQRRVPELLHLTGLVEAGGRKVRSYSKGMKQRLGLAQAMIHDPAVLFLDEPTDGVDPVGRATIRDFLGRLKAAGKTIFLNSHLLSEVERLCDRVAIIDRGQLVREGTVDQLTAAGHEVIVTTVPAIDEAAVAALRTVATAVTVTADGCRLTLTGDADIDRVVDLLRGRGVGIRGLVRERQTLEEVFLEVVDRGAGDALRADPATSAPSAPGGTP